MNKYLIIMLAVVLLALGGWYYAAHRTPAVLQSNAGIDSSVVSYTDKAYGFTIWYPNMATSSAVNFEGYLPVTQSPLVSFVLPRTVFTGTNLVEAGVYIGATSSPRIVATCTASSQMEDEQNAGTARIGGVTFAVFTSTGAGAGNLYDERTFRTVHNGSCIEIIELLHSGNIANYPAGQVVEFDKQKYSNVLEAVVKTLTFN